MLPLKWLPKECGNTASGSIRHALFHYLKPWYFGSLSALSEPCFLDAHDINLLLFQYQEEFFIGEAPNVYATDCNALCSPSLYRLYFCARSMSRSILPVDGLVFAVPCVCFTVMFDLRFLCTLFLERVGCVGGLPGDFLLL
jgi:hypothetical protein